MVMKFSSAGAHQWTLLHGGSSSDELYYDGLKAEGEVWCGQVHVPNCWKCHRNYCGIIEWQVLQRHNEVLFVHLVLACLSFLFLDKTDRKEPMYSMMSKKEGKLLGEAKCQSRKDRAQEI